MLSYILPPHNKNFKNLIQDEYLTQLLTQPAKRICVRDRKQPHSTPNRMVSRTIPSSTQTEQPLYTEPQRRNTNSKK